ncbi:oxaloacetate-decarboxylating malate dehydrogenase [bacterium]|nr:oxaloacetate-decarboxylating malate dehydrogenase [bacterium]
MDGPADWPNIAAKMKKPIPTGAALLENPRYNKDSAFTLEERTAFGVEGLLPPAVFSIDQQVAVEMEHLNAKPDPLEQYVGLIALLNRNETLFHRVLLDHLEKLAPIIYTPTVGLACQRFSHIFRRPHGLFISPADRGQIARRLENLSDRDIRLIVVTDNERILGLGDQGVGGMAIPVGKLILYTAGAGIHPSHCLPVSLDVGTDNAALLEDPFYLGHRARRLRGPEYDSFVKEFVQAVKTVFPRAVLQWEDFKKGNAFRLLERYVDVLPSFNDDIQGTAAVTLAGILTGLRHTGKSLRDQRMLFVGSGGAGVGIGRLIRAALEHDGVPDEAIRRQFVFLDSSGVLRAGRANEDPHKAAFALSEEDAQAMGMANSASMTLLDAVKAWHPTILIGTSGQPGVFTPEVIQHMAAGCPRPMIFPLSNPTSNTECTPSEAIIHSNGQALVATGSPFEPVEFNGHRYVIGQCNNVFVFPGIGLGLLISEARRVVDALFLAAADALAELTYEKHAAEKALFPSVANLREVSLHVAFRVARAAREQGVGKDLSDDELQRRVREWCWQPNYQSYVESRS